ncbi:hypothetical protein Glove_456g39 [Diversispora epigaea]|uniref:Uncharacterized protein n=1 Tax=Diversispora epigaea TaxID=1348612 RepID=A0A397GPY6_9GLOM|nr:hypothetical protein Glove_456g39 [Diversispora epigaea]
MSLTLRRAHLKKRQSLEFLTHQNIVLKLLINMSLSENQKGQVGIDNKFLQRYNYDGEINSNAVVYGLYRIQKPDVNQLIPMKDGTLNCVAQRVIKHFDQAKRGNGLTNIRRQKIDTREKKVRNSGAKVQDVTELEKILKRPIKLFDITHGTIFNSDKYQSGDESQRISQFVLEDGRTFRTWKKHTEIIESCKQLVDDAINWQFQENIINEEKKLIISESLKVVDLAEQVFGANHAGSRLANEINEWHPITGKINNTIKQACIEYGHGGCWNSPDYNVNDVICIDMKECYPASMRGQGECITWFKRFGHPTHHLVRIAVNGKLPQENISGFAQQIKVWLPKNRDVSCAIIGKFTQGDKIDEKRLTHRLVTDEGELDFLIKDCTDAGTFADREKCPLGFILTYYEGHQFQYIHLRASMIPIFVHSTSAYINLLEMLRRFDPNEIVRIVTDSIYVQKEAFYKIENVPAFFKQEKVKDQDLCPHNYTTCVWCEEDLLILRYIKWIKEFQKTETPLVKYECKMHNSYICRFCLLDWYYNSDSYVLSQQKEKIQEIKPGQWRDKGEKIYGPVTDIVYWPKNRHWESIKKIPDSISPPIHDPITRYRNSYLNGGGGLVKQHGQSEYSKT